MPGALISTANFVFRLAQKTILRRSMNDGADMAKWGEDVLLWNY
jgi:hypothetical protein